MQVINYGSLARGVECKRWTSVHFHVVAFDIFTSIRFFAFVKCFSGLESMCSCWVLFICSPEYQTGGCAVLFFCFFFLLFFLSSSKVALGTGG